MPTSDGKHHPESQRLDSWKAIADFIGKTPRTAQRWQAKFGLPVYRVAGGNSSVFAFPEELHAWLRQRRSTNDENSGSDSLLQQGRESVDQMVTALPAMIEGAHETAGRLVREAYNLWPVLSRRSVGRITRMFRAASDLDPENALAFAGLAHALMFQGMVGTLGIPEAYISARAAAARALEFAPHSGEAQCAAAWVRMVLEHDRCGAHEIFRKLAELPDANGRAIVGLGMSLLGGGRIRDAKDVVYQATVRDPLVSFRWAILCWMDYLLGDFEESRDQIRNYREFGLHERILTGVEALVCLQLDKPSEAIAGIGKLIGEDPGFPLLRGALGHAYARGGDFETARILLQELMPHGSSSRKIPFYAVALILVALGEQEEAIKSLEMCYSVGSIWSFGLHADPSLAPLRGNPSFEAFLRTAFPRQREFSNPLATAAIGDARHGGGIWNLARSFRPAWD